MNQTKNLKGIIYRIYNSGQADKIINIIDPEGKKNTILAKGVKKPNSRKAHSIDLGNLIETKVVEGYNIPLMTEIKLINEFRQWKNDYKKMVFLQFFCEIIDKFCFEENKDAMLYKILYNTLNSNSDRVVYIASIFILKLLNETGHLPKLNECVVTSTDINPDAVYTLTDYVGYVSDSAISKSGVEAEQIPSRIVKTQKYIVDNDFNKTFNIILDPSEEMKMFRIELGWLEHTIESGLKSKNIVLNSLK